MIEVQFYALTGKFHPAKTELFPALSAATEAVKAYAEAGGYTGVRFVDGPEDEFRWTAKAPGGRAGRNVAFGVDLAGEFASDNLGDLIREVVES